VRAALGAEMEEALEERRSTVLKLNFDLPVRDQVGN
jgi:hypothetical protein